MTSADNATDGALVLSFGVITDTHIRAPKGDQSSPYPVNDLANDRAKFAANLLAQHNTAFNVHLGDMVHPLPGMLAYDGACEAALEIFKPLQPTLYFVAGNHDIGDKPMPGLPAAAVSSDAITAYKKHFGDDYYHFAHNGCLFVVLNSSLINSDHKQADAQKAWLQELLAEADNQRIFLFLHYPLFIHSETEAEHYDNIAEPGRSWLTALIKQYSVELVLSGHVHHHFYNRIGNCKFHTLPPTSFTRQDYSEIFKIDAAPEFGRDDTGKYSVAVVDVYEHGHDIRIIPTGGVTSDTSRDTVTSKDPGLASVNKPITVHLRHAWYESIDLPYNGPMEEFSRKRTRNDYIFLRLKQMGIRDVRVTIDEFIDSASFQRVQDYIADGFRFHALCPQHLLKDKLSKACDRISLLSSVECVTAGSVESIIEPDIHNVNIPIYVGYALTGAHHSKTDKPFAHSVSSGFEWSKHEQILNILNSWQSKVSGVVFQIPWELETDILLPEMQSIFSALEFECIANIRLAKSNPAEANFDDQAIKNRVASVVSCASSLPNVRIQLDTAMDIDRGYSPRNGLFDRLCNLRAAGQYLCDNTE